jgi:hypothetical protein
MCRRQTEPCASATPVSSPVTTLTPCTDVQASGGARYVTGRCKPQNRLVGQVEVTRGRRAHTRRARDAFVGREPLQWTFVWGACVCVRKLLTSPYAKAQRGGPHRTLHREVDGRPRPCNIGMCTYQLQECVDPISQAKKHPGTLNTHTLEQDGGDAVFLTLG